MEFLNFIYAHETIWWAFVIMLIVVFSRGFRQNEKKEITESVSSEKKYSPELISKSLTQLALVF